VTYDSQPCHVLAEIQPVELRNVPPHSGLPAR